LLLSAAATIVIAGPALRRERGDRVAMDGLYIGGNVVYGETNRKERKRGKKGESRQAVQAGYINSLVPLCFARNRGGRKKEGFLGSGTTEHGSAFP